jgi:hypothetical protein
MGLTMIRLITPQNFPYLDRQIERAYRRRCQADDQPCACVEIADDEMLLRMIREARKRSRRRNEWMRRLAREVSTLSTKSHQRGTAGRRRAPIALEADAAAQVAPTGRGRRRAG